jgi:hypothetical protein
MPRCVQPYYNANQNKAKQAELQGKQKQKLILNQNLYRPQGNHFRQSTDDVTKAL